MNKKLPLYGRGVFNSILNGEKKSITFTTSLKVEIVPAWYICEFDRYSSTIHLFFVNIRDLSINITEISVKFKEYKCFFKTIIQQAFL